MFILIFGLVSVEEASPSKQRRLSTEKYGLPVCKDCDKMFKVHVLTILFKVDVVFSRKNKLNKFNSGKLG